MFIASKLMAFATQPLAWLAMLMLASLLCINKHPAWARRLGIAALVWLLMLGWEPLPDALLRQLESRYPALSDSSLPPDCIGVVVLGGATESAYVWEAAPGQSALNGAAERMTEALALLRRQPHLQVLFTGGEGELFANGLSEAQRAQKFFADQGVAPGKIRYESASRTTYENALLSRSVAGIDPAQHWLLLTSAWHMPRAMATFRKRHWNVTAYPVDYRAGSRTPWTQYGLDTGAAKWRIALHEGLGLLIYRLRGQA